MFIGIDLGTSSVKAILADANQRIIAAANEPLSISRPFEGWSEQEPEAWWRAAVAAIDRLHAADASAVRAVRGIGLAGQMHGAVVLGADGETLRPAILWNDVRSVVECGEFEEAFPASRTIAGNAAMPGFTAPKLLWIRRHEPHLYSKIARVILPKAYLRYRMTGEFAEDMSDASGTLWLDIAGRDWSDAALEATGLTRRMMPRLVEGTEPAGELTPTLVKRWGMNVAPVIAGGAGDNAAGAVGLGAIHPGRCFLSLGTSGVIWATTARFAPNPASAVHAFCHAIPATWHQMAVTLSAASCLAWWANVTSRPEPDLLGEMNERQGLPGQAIFLPYLSGERTPHNDGQVRGAFFGLAHDLDRPALTQAVLEGVAFSFRDGLNALETAGTRINEADLIGGGSRSRVWTMILASVLGIPLNRLADGDFGVAFGAMRLGRIATTKEPPNDVCLPLSRIETIEPDCRLIDAYQEQFAVYRRLYPVVSTASRREA